MTSPSLDRSVRDEAITSVRAPNVRIPFGRQSGVPDVPDSSRGGDMRRIGIFLLIVIALIATAGPVAAQPKVTITGLVDNITSYTHNLSQTDLNPARNKESEWYSRTRIRPDITAEVGTTKFVLGLEIDETWGQTGNLGAAGACGGTASTVNAGLGAGTVCSSPQRFGTTAGWQLNTDTQGVIEIKWAYTEFDVPLMPVPTRLRLGAQPFEAQYKIATLATGDFSGAHLTSQLTPMLRANLTYAQMEEASTGPKDGFIRGEDFAIITSIEITPFKGLDIRPIFSYASYTGPASTSTRQARGGVGTGTANFQVCPSNSLAGAANGCPVPGNGSAIEDRFTVGVDSRWRFGPFSLDPTVFYQFGSRDQMALVASRTSGPGVQTTLKRDAWYVDIRGGWQAGPLLLELAGIYTTGNKAQDRIDLNGSRLKFYEPLDTDGSYFSGWAEIMGNATTDYFNAFRAPSASLRPTINVGYDKYGLILAGARASYALTPSFTLRTMASARWTAQSVDTASTVANATGLTPRCSALTVDNGSCVDRGTARYLGTELDIGFQWRFAPNVALDFAAAYVFMGPGYSSPGITNITTGNVTNGRNPQDVQTIATRVRYTF
jgi:hypothetical protein